MVWYSHFFKYFPQFVVIYTVKDFDAANKTEVDVFLELYCFFCDPADVGNVVSGLIWKYLHKPTQKYCLTWPMKLTQKISHHIFLLV